ncbi:MAG TPA: hypothetical protein VGM39_02005, partial [Kofleriaceae bacterium]
MLRRFVHPSFALVLVVGCLTGSVDYSPEQDAQAFDEIARSYSTQSLQLSLCEDTTVSWSPGGNTCQIEHVVRGDGGAEQHETRGAGCGGCPFENIAYVRGTLNAPNHPEPLAIRGEVHLGTNADPYEYPYYVQVDCVGDTPCSLSGQLEADGTLTVDYGNIAGVTQSQLTLTAGGPAV